MLRLCARPLTPEEAKDDDLQAAQTKSMHDVVHELVKQVTSPNKLVREEVQTVVSHMSIINPLLGTI